MRIREVSTGHRLPEKLKLFVMRVLGRREPPDVVKTLLYRPKFFGKPANALFQAALRGPSEWTVGERELMAAYVSRLNRCVF
jgi:hypothetical protein